MPVILGFCTGHIYEHRLYHESFNSHLQELLDVLRKLKNVSNPSQSYVDLLELSEIVGTQALS